MSSTGAGPRLAVEASSLASAVRQILRASRRSAADEITLSYEKGSLVIEATGAAVSVPAEGQWPGIATAHNSMLRLLAKLEGGAIEMWFGADGRLHVGTTSCDARWSQSPVPIVDLPLEPTLRQILRLRLDYSDEELLAAGLLNRVTQAERERDAHIANALHHLKALGDFRAALTEMVRREVYG